MNFASTTSAAENSTRWSEIFAKTSVVPKDILRLQSRLDHADADCRYFQSLFVVAGLQIKSDFEDNLEIFFNSQGNMLWPLIRTVFDGSK